MHGLGEVAERLRRATVQVHSKGERGTGSGVIWNAEGLIVTNAHVARSPEAQIELWDGRRIAGRVTSHDPRRDLATLKMSASGLEPATAGNSAALQPGELVIAIGSPLGFAGALSTGVVHSLGTVQGMGSRPWIRANVRLAPGNSGGPLADARGGVVGINTAVMNGLGLAIPVSTVAEFLQSGPSPMLGVSLRPMDAGLLLLEVDPGGRAAAASLKAGDMLLLTLDDLHRALDSGQDVLRVAFLRGPLGAGRLPVREAFVPLGVRTAEAA